MPTKRPVNYRTNAFHLFGKDISIGGMAKPEMNANVDDALRYLVDNEHRTILIGLKEQSYAADAERSGLTYIHIPITDWEPVPISTYDAIHAAVKQATDDGKLITIHCGAGNGRTGTALAALKLREIIEQAAIKNPAVLNDNPSHTAKIYVTSGCTDVDCTPFVKEAVEKIRMERSAPDESGNASVETAEDIESLIQYEQHLRATIKHEIQHEQGASQILTSDYKRHLSELTSPEDNKTNSPKHPFNNSLME